MTEPLVSIIIPTFNRADLIGETINSVLSQTYSNWECIIVDDGSENQTIEVLNQYAKKDARVKVFGRPNYKAKGANSCRNYGFELSKGEYIKWFDSDDMMLPDLLKKQVNKIDSTHVNICEILKYNFEKNIELGKNKVKSNRLIENYFTGEIAFYVCGPLWRKDFLSKQKELFDESISNLDDWDFNLRMLYQNPTISYTDEPLVRYRIHENSLSQEINKLNLDEIRSEINAREKHVAILESQKNDFSVLLNAFILERLKYIFGVALVKKDKNWFPYLKLLLKKQIELKYFGSLIKTVFATLVYKIFAKGEKLLKKL